MLEKIDATKTFLISDTHFGHENILKYDKRPFKTTKEMDEYMISAWNNVVTDNDIIIHLGDVFWGDNSDDRMYHVINRLKGRKWLVKGNHDYLFVKTKAATLFEKITDYLEVQFFKNIQVDHHLAVLFHFPIHTWNKKHKGSYHFHGHTHGALLMGDKSLDVGANIKYMNYTPQKISDLLIIAKPDTL